MKKEIIKEPESTMLNVDIMFYCAFIIVGIIILNFTYLNKIPAYEYATTIFYVMGFFSILSYFINRKRDDYEFLILGFVSIIVGAFINNNINYSDFDFILSNAISIYTLSAVFTKLFIAEKLWQKKNINYFPKLSSSLLLTILGIIITIDFNSYYVLENILLGYYVLLFGLICLFEPILIISSKKLNISKILEKLMGCEEKKKSKETKKIKEIEVKKPVKKEEKIPEKKVAKTTTKKQTEKKPVKKTSTKKTSKKEE